MKSVIQSLYFCKIIVIYLDHLFSVVYFPDFFSDDLVQLNTSFERLKQTQERKENMALKFDVQNYFICRITLHSELYLKCDLQ